MKKTQVKSKEIKTSKYLTFILGSEQYGFDIDKVIEIIGMQDITPMPKTPDYLRGVINLRGIIHPVIDLNQKFSMSKTEETKETCIIVVTVNKNKQQKQMGIIVDKVSEVEDISEKDIEIAPNLGNKINTEFIAGIAKTNGNVTILLDLQKILSNQELETFSNIKE